MNEKKHTKNSNSKINIHSTYNLSEVSIGNSNRTNRNNIVGDSKHTPQSKPSLKSNKTKNTGNAVNTPIVFQTSGTSQTRTKENKKINQTKPSSSVISYVSSPCTINSQASKRTSFNKINSQDKLSTYSYSNQYDSNPKNSYSYVPTYNKIVQIDEDIADLKQTILDIKQKHSSSFLNKEELEQLEDIKNPQIQEQFKEIKNDIHKLLLDSHYLAKRYENTETLNQQATVINHYIQNNTSYKKLIKTKGQDRRRIGKEEGNINRGEEQEGNCI
mmetsp:Transcript_25089/g.26166  ORF Transcript_25089/g.26166 Transcript_25089/m.26166 type:complete len:273 (+) Transcript_25089:21-839(+)